MHVRGRPGTRHLKGKQMPVTLYLPPNKYWLLKWLCKRKCAMQALLREAVDELLEVT